MPAESIAEQILTKIEARLKGIASGAIYFYTPGDVTRDWKNFDEVKSFPFYGVIEGRRQRQEDTYLKIDETLTAIIIGWVKHDAQRRTVLNRAIADVIRAIYTDETWGGLALITKVSEIVTDEAAVVAKPHAYFELTLSIEYQLDRATA